MLRIRQFLNRARPLQDPHKDDEAGAILVAVVVIIFLGFLVATTIAAFVVFTIQQNVGNRQNTQAYIAAESGRDSALAAVTAQISSGQLTCPPGGVTVPVSTVTGLDYTATVRWAYAPSGQQPKDWASVASGATSYTACPVPPSTPPLASDQASNWVVVHAVGNADGVTSTVDAAYPWTIEPDTRPAGTLAYFDGAFKATKSTYDGDLVIRGSSDYSCNNSLGVDVNGDLWVTNAGVQVTGPCHITGSIYAHGDVVIKNKDFKVDGDIVTDAGSVSFQSDNATVGGQIYAGKMGSAGGDVIFTKAGTMGHLGDATECGALTPAQPSGCLIGGAVKAMGSVTSPVPAGWKKANGDPVVGQAGSPAPVIVPSLTAVQNATTWLELDQTTDWGVAASAPPSPNAFCTGTALATLLGTAGAPVLVDLSGCGSAVTVSPGSPAMKRDAVIYVPSTSSMNVNLGGTITKGAGDPQLLIVHGDANRTDNKPTCTTGADSLNVGNAVGVRTMIYSACGVNNTMSLTMTGQLYMGNDGLHLNGGVFTCAPMGWPPAFKNLSCGVKGADGIFDPSRTMVTLGDRAYQTEPVG